jgi:hypothetical protein
VGVGTRGAHRMGTGMAAMDTAHWATLPARAAVTSVAHVDFPDHTELFRVCEEHHRQLHSLLECSPLPPLIPPSPASLGRCSCSLVGSLFQVLFSQFRYFFNFYFLLLACSQFVPEMRLGALYTYWVPLVSRLVCGQKVLCSHSLGVWA